MDPTTAARPPLHGHPHETLDVPALVRRTQDLLAAGVPLTLLLDLGDDAGPRSAQRYRSEGGDAAAWLPQPRRG